MKGRVFNKTQAGNTGLSFVGNRQPIGLMPDKTRMSIRQWCDINGIFMSDDGSHILWKNTDQGKTDLIKLFLKYHKSEVHNCEFIFAHNFNSDIRINLSGMMKSESVITAAINKIIEKNKIVL